MRADEEQKRPKHIAAIDADGRKGTAVLVRQEGITYLIMDAFVLAKTTCLAIKELGTDKNIDYSEPELMSDSPLLRFKVVGEPHASPLELSSLSDSGPPSGFLSSNDSRFAKDDPTIEMIAALGTRGELQAIHVGEAWVSTRTDKVWTAAKPADLRAQLDLLARSRESVKKDKLSDKEAADLRETRWLTPYLESQSAALLQVKQPPPQP
ncbi:hypothetical protein GCM10023212_10830 [Luteolibacter yonseiensis]